MLPFLLFALYENWIENDTQENCVHMWMKMKMNVEEEEEKKNPTHTRIWEKQGAAVCEYVCIKGVDAGEPQTNEIG